MTFEEQVGRALHAADTFEPSPDLFARVTRSIEEDAAHRQRIRSLVVSVTIAIGILGVFLLVVVDRIEGEIIAPFWALEVVTTITMLAIVLSLGPAIRRFGTSFESDVFRSDQPTGRSFLTLIDIAYYMVFGAYTLMTIRYAPPAEFAGSTPDLAMIFSHETGRIAGLLLLMGLLHTVTLIALPVTGLVHSANTRRAKRFTLGDSAPVPHRRNDHVDKWVTATVWATVGVGLLFVAFILVSALAGLAE